MKFPASECANGRCCCAFTCVEVDSTEIARLCQESLDSGGVMKFQRYFWNLLNTASMSSFCMVSEFLSLSFVVALGQYTREALWELFVSVESE